MPRRTRPATPELAVAQMIALWRADGPLSAADLVAGVYLAGWDRLSRLWRTPEAFEELMAAECGLDLPRWCYLADFSRRKPTDKFAGLSPAASQVLRAAGQIATGRGEARAPKIQVGCEDFLVALIARDDLRIARLVKRSGLDTRKLRNSAQGRHREHPRAGGRVPEPERPE